MKVIPPKENAPRKRGYESKKKNSRSNHTDSSAEAQRSRLYDRLTSFGSTTTIEARRELDVMMTASRIHELRHRHGCMIDTVWTMQATECGKLHRIARYVWRGKA